jgi:hypothetical protein
VSEAIANAKADRIVTVEPTVIQRDGKKLLSIPEEAGYGKVEVPMDRMGG